MKKLCVLGLLVAIAACDKKEEPSPTPKESVPPAASASAAPAKEANEIPATTANADARAAYERGLDLLDNVRSDEARDELKKALAADPKFWSAMAMEGSCTPGAEGDKMIADAIAGGASLPAAELLTMKQAQAFHGNDPAKAAEIGKQIVAAAPKSARAQLWLGNALQFAGRQEEASAAFKKAIELDASLAPAYNSLGYAELQTGKLDDAIGHLKKYAELKPKDPNPQDSLGEALLMAGKYDAAEGAFKKAIDADSKFLMAWSGLGYVRLYKGDWAGAYEAFGKHRDGATNLVDDKEFAYRAILWAQLAQGKPADALKTLDGWDADAAKAKDAESATHAQLQRAGMLIETAKPADALKALTAAGAAIDKWQAPDSRKARAHVYQHGWETLAYARLSKAPEADKARGMVEEAVAAIDDKELKSVGAFARGEAALAKNDAKGALEAFKACVPNDMYCAWELSKAQDRSGDKDGAKATLAKIQKEHHRSEVNFYVWAKTAPPPAK